VTAAFKSATARRIALLVVAAALVGGYFLLGLDRYLNLGFFKAHQDELARYAGANPLRAAAMAALLYMTVVALSIPGTVLLTLCAGAIFGVFWGTVLVSFSSVFGATIAFLSSRFLLRDWVQRRFGGQLVAFNKGIERDGAFYLISLGLIPVFPYSVINLVMLLETILLVNAGTQIARIDSLAGLLSPELIGSLVLLGITPLAIRFYLDRRKR
jgi:uncharacterized membrane protein YdjX (TVP38/TMEM64 family)